MIYLLDTNAVIDVLRGLDPRVERRLRARSPADVALSAVVLHKLYFGAFRSARTDSNLALIEDIGLEVLPLTQEDAREAGRIRAVLTSAGTTIGPLDVLIAGQALARGATLVTHNTREFQRVEGLMIDDWSL